ncbi:Mfa1 family fimbria major subunit [Alistipes sp. OttesenSCG-928-L06]|nr:Mfa1 family fimbria major subunit [Alistipes sp. OttesenSCG-928-L06]
MKIQTILAAGLAAMVAFSSCSKEDSGAVTPESKSEAMMNISFKLPQTLTRAELAGNEAENAVKAMDVFVFKANGTAPADGAHTRLSATQFHQVSGSNVWTLNDDNQIETIAGENMHIYVGINLPTALQTEFNTETNLLAQIATLADLQSDGFAMFSTQTVKTLEPKDKVAVNKVDVKVDRIMSKVVASTDKASYAAKWSATDNSPEITFTYTIKEFNVYNEAIKTYVAKRDHTLFNKAGETGVLNTFAASQTKANKNVVNGHPSDAGMRAAMAGYYIGENIPASTLNSNTTYAFIGTTVSVSHFATWDDAAKKVKYTATAFGADGVYMVKYNGFTFVTNSVANAEALCLGLKTIDSTKDATYYTFHKGWVHFPVWLNEYGTNDYRVGRNEFIHVKVNGIANMDGIFPGYPGVDGTNPEKPIDPTEPKPGVNPEPKPGPDPVDGYPAVLQVNVEVNPWTYMANDVELQ